MSRCTDLGSRVAGVGSDHGAWSAVAMQGLCLEGRLGLQWRVFRLLRGLRLTTLLS